MNAYEIACEIVEDMFEYAKTPADLAAANRAREELTRER
jgi:hypothetical protein